MPLLLLGLSVINQSRKPEKCASKPAVNIPNVVKVANNEEDSDCFSSSISFSLACSIIDFLLSCFSRLFSLAAISSLSLRFFLNNNCLLSISDIDEIGLIIS